MISMEQAFGIFERAIADYHLTDHVDTPLQNPYPEGSFEALLYHKNWIDTVQWHLEDLIRDPQIDPAEALTLKRRIDKSNQERTDMVEQIDDFYLEQFEKVTIQREATLNTESPAWALDRLSILALKIYHMQEQVNRQDASEEHIDRCQKKLVVLLEQHQDLTTAISQLLVDLTVGRKVMKVYRQMKMYNDKDTNPVLYKDKS